MIVARVRVIRSLPIGAKRQGPGSTKQIVQISVADSYRRDENPRDPISFSRPANQWFVPGAHGWPGLVSSGPSTTIARKRSVSFRAGPATHLGGYRWTANSA